jgi:cytoskeletal protein CcmA (bactofilin family)
MSEEKKQTVIEEGTGFKGDFDSECPIVVKGRIEGRMSAPSLTVDATGEVSGTVRVKELRSQGVISGEYDADFVQLSGTVKDDTVIRARSLEVNLAPQRGKMQITFGQCELEVGDVPDKAAAIARAESRPEDARPESARPDMFADARGPTTDPPPYELPELVAGDGRRRKRDGKNGTLPPPGG